MRQVFDPLDALGRLPRRRRTRALSGAARRRQRRQDRGQDRRAGSAARASRAPRAATPVCRLPSCTRRESGESFVKFVADAEGMVHRSPYQSSQLSFYEPFAFQTREVLCERFHTGTSPTWERHRREAHDHGRAGSLLWSRRRGRPAPRRGRSPIGPFPRRHADEDAFDVAASFLAADVATAVGFVPRQKTPRPTSCARCASAATPPTTDPHLRRARFNAEAIDRIGPVTATVIRRRLSLPRTSPELMPPLRVGELPRWAIARIDRYLRDHCADPGACD